VTKTVRNEEWSSTRELFRHSGYWRWSVATQAFRLPFMMAPLAFVYAGAQQRHSVGLGGILVTAWTLAPAIAAPFAGRVYDRIGVTKWPQRVLAGVAVGILAIGASFALGLPAPLLILLTALVALASSGVGSSTRTLLGECVPDRLLQSALSLDSSVIEVTVVGAPLIVAASAVAGPEAPIYAMGIIELIAAMLLQRRQAGTVQAPEESTQAAPGQRGRLWTNRRYIFWLLAAAAFGQSLGTLEIGAVPISSHLHHGSTEAASFVAALGAASALAGLVYAALSARLRVNRIARACVLLVVMIVAGLGVSFADGAWDVAVCYVAIGLCTAPLNTIVSYSAGKDVDPSRCTEAFGGIGMTNSFAYAIPGVLLAVVPLAVMLRCGVALAVAAVLLAPLLSVKASAKDDRYQPVGSRTAAE
jgi:MFS family permease